MGKRPAQGGHRLIVQPDDGVEPVLGLLASARHTLRTVQFTLDDPRFVNAVLDAHRRQVAVHVLLNPHKSSGERGNDATFEQLKRAGIAVEWTHPRFPVTHEKAIVIDDERALIASFNLSAKYFGETRDHGVLTDHPLQVRAIVSAFEADWRRKPFQPREDSGLVWSPDNARRLIAGFIDDARHTLDVQHPKFVDATVIDRLAAARSRGVKVRVLCGGKHGLSPWDLHDTFASLRILERVDVKVRRQKHLKVHAKLLRRQTLAAGLDEPRPQRLRPAARARRGRGCVRHRGAPGGAVRARLAQGRALERARPARRRDARPRRAPRRSALRP